GETIIEVADRLGVEIPRLCYKPGMRPDGNCRACMVEIKGERVLAPSCCRAPAPGMEVSSESPRAKSAQKMIVELLAADMPTCVACGECVQACPTGALAPAHDAYLVVPDRVVPSVCPYCGVGCQLDYHVKDNAIVRVEGRDGPANHDRLCVKGRFGFDYVQHPQRLTKPLIRKSGVLKTADFVMDPANPGAAFREASWEE